MSTGTALTGSAPTPARTLRALLVGIDDYHDAVPSLRGCVADVERAAALFRRRAEAAGDAVDVVLLANERATREAVIDAFRTHLGAAGPADTALFYFSGHGSQERAVLPGHLALEPDGLNETLVLADSRGPAFDLADKELARLVGEVSAKAGHVLVVLDCCHSGTGVRAALEDGVRERRAPMDERRRGPGDYLPGAVGLGAGGAGAVSAGAWGSGARGAATGPAPRTRGDGAPDVAAYAAPARASRADWLAGETEATTGGYVLLAACRSDQTAKEVRLDGADRGAFSVALERALASLAGEPSYLDVHRWIAAAVRNLVSDQSPVLEAPTSRDADRPFLGGVAAPREALHTAAFVAHRGWVLDAGRLHGLALGTPEAPAAVDLLPLTGGGGPLTSARVVEVAATSALLDPADPGALDRGATYRAVVTAAGRPDVVVAVVDRGEARGGAGDKAGGGAVASAVRARIARSAVVRLASGDDDGDLVVECTAPGLRVVRPGAARALAAAEEDDDAPAVERAVRACEHIGRWLGVARRQNPTSRLRADQVTLTVSDQAGDPIPAPAGAAEVEYTGPDDADGPVIKVRYANRADVALHCAVLALSEMYGIECLTGGGSVLLRPGEAAWVTDELDRPQLRTFVPAGQDRTTDLLVLVVSTEPFDAQAMAQPELEPPTLLRGPTATRGVTGRASMPARGPDWATRQVLVTTVRPGAWAVLGADGARSLGADVAVLGHPGLRAKVRLASLPTASRAAVVPLLPPAFLAPEAHTEPVVLGATRAVGEGLSVLELDDVVGAETVTREEPLRLRLERPLGEGELLLPVAFDGEDYLPLGCAVGRGDVTEVRLTRLPAQGAAVQRSLGGSLKVLFRKVVLTRLGAGYAYPLLSLVRFEGGEPVYVHEPAAVAAGVRGAERVVLVVHGILGDSRGMVGVLGGGPDPIASRYDAVLALDYENINTPVSETAAVLESRLERLGLATGRRVDVLAHSMGGLLSRW